MGNSYIKNLQTPIAIIGLGKSGRSALSLLTEFGFTSDQIITFDEKNPAAELSRSEQLAGRGIKTLVVSPGVSLKAPWLQKQIHEGAHLTSEISLAASLIDTEKIIGVTGSVGKSTVVSLLGAGVKSFDFHSFTGGNLGIPFCDYAVDILRGKPRAQWIILELSSYQLENCHGLRLENSIVTYLSSNHLERYNSLKDYYDTKMTVTAITRNICLFNKSSPDCVSYAANSLCRYELINAVTFPQPELLAEIALIGSHNKDNFSLAAEMAKISGWPQLSISEMAKYRGLSHRLEFVGTVGGVTYVNDSKATAMESVLVASRGCLEGLSSANRLFLLLGGKDKNLPWEDLSVLSSHESITPVFFGTCGQLAQQKSQLSGEYFEKLGAAIHFCQMRAQPGDVVLLSPGGTSLDEFSNFEERGDFFKTLVLAEPRN